MKILQIISGLGNGGAEKFVVELSNQLSLQSEIVLCTFKAVEDWMTFPKMLSDNVKLISLNKKPGFDTRTFKRLYNLLKVEKPKVVHFHLDATIKYLLPFVLLFPHVKFIYTLHSDLNQEKKKIFSQLRHIKFIIKKITFVCIAPNIYDDYKQAYPDFEFTMIENGIRELISTHQKLSVKEEIHKLKFNDETIVFVSVGRLDENKNQELIVKAFNELGTHNVISLIIGKDPSQDTFYLNKLLKQKGKNTFLLGEKTNIADYLCYSDALLMSSLNEGLPIAVLEAFALGLPVIATPAGGLKSVVNNTVNGFVSDDFSLDALLKVIHTFLKLKETEKQFMKEKSTEAFVSLYDINRCADKYLLLYKED